MLKKLGVLRRWRYEATFDLCDRSSFFWLSRTGPDRRNARGAKRTLRRADQGIHRFTGVWLGCLPFDEQYKVAGNGSVPDSIVEALKQENPGESVLALSWGVEVGTPEPESELKFVRHSQEEHTYSGTGHYKDDNQTRWFVLRDGDTVIEILLGRFAPGLADLKADTKYDVTVLDENSEDLQTQIAIIGRREHVDWDDAADEAHSSFQQLVRVSAAGKIVFDRSICSLHHIKMEKRNVEVAYGMLAYSKAESYCIAHYPNFRDYAVGGCIVGDTKFTQIYICPKCVAECNEYKCQHPEENKNPLN